MEEKTNNIDIGREYLKNEKSESESHELYDTPMNPEVGAIATPYISDLVEVVSGREESRFAHDFEPISEMSMSRATERQEKTVHQNENIKDYFERLLKDKIIIDIGAGVTGGGYILADYCKAKEYIGIEPNFALTANNVIAEKVASKENESTPYRIIQKDGVQYLIEVAPESAGVVFLMGIDTEIIPRQKWEDLIRGVYNVLAKDGILVMGGGMDKVSEIIDKYFLEKEDFDNLIRKDEKNAYLLLPSVYKKK